MNGHRDDLAIVHRFGDRLPCCDTYPLRPEHGRLVCRCCGTIYKDLSTMVRDAFPGCMDVTAMTPRRLLGR